MATIPWLLALAPAVLALAATWPIHSSQGSARSMSKLASGAAIAAALAALAGATLYFGTGAAGEGALIGRLGASGLALTLYVDTLTVVMAVLVSGVGAAVVLYSRTYLDGDPRHAHFMRWLCLTLAAVLLLVLSGNLLQFALAWAATSLCLHQLLVFYRDRPQAQIAARKKFIVSRLGDVGLLAAVAIALGHFGTLDFDALFRAAVNLQDGSGTPAAVHGLAALLVFSALVKSAQLPFHGWLTEVMETPTPVSALLHAGIINAGGFLILRFSDLIVLSPFALGALVCVGAATALFAALVMLTQTSIKVSLAWSTIAQMGFMMLQCGLGAFPAALLHICAHSLYKAYAFLSSGSVIEHVRARTTAPPVRAPSVAGNIAGIVVAAAVVALVALPFDTTLLAAPGPFALAAILAMGVWHLVAEVSRNSTRGAVFLRGIAAGAGVAGLYFALQSAASAVAGGALAAPPTEPGAFDLTAAALVIAAFAAVLVVQQLGPSRRTMRWQALYVHLLNGFYLNLLATRLVNRWWPVAAPATPRRGVSA